MGTVFLALILLSLYWLIPIFGPIHPEKASGPLLVSWLLMRDFQTLPEEKRIQLVHRFDEVYGPASGKKPEFSFSAFVKRQIRSGVKKHYADVAVQRKLMKEKEAFLAFELSRTERNIQTLIKTMLLERNWQWEQLTKEKKTDFMKSEVEKIVWWRNFYQKFLEAAEAPSPTVLELLREFEVMNARWQWESSPEDARNLKNVLGEIRQAFLWKEVESQLQNLQNVGAGFSNLLNFGGGRKKSQNSNPKEKSQDGKDAL
ncbi:MAG: hypothetical protein LBQ54_09230 [Planctomycetaceae bacterium]|nr:hypothetical protein [Planctomycetaceae bacterium]